MMASRFLGRSREAHHGRIYWAAEGVFQWSLRTYRTSLAWVMKRRPAAVAVSVAVLAGTCLVLWKIPKGFLANDDIGFLRGRFEVAEGTSYDAMVRYRNDVAAVVGADTGNVDVFMTRVSSGSGGVSIRLKPRGRRRMTADQIVQALRPKLAAIPGVRVFLSSPPAINIGGMMSSGQYQYTLQCPDLKTLCDNAPKPNCATLDVTEGRRSEETRIGRCAIIDVTKGGRQLWGTNRSWSICVAYLPGIKEQGGGTRLGYWTSSVPSAGITGNMPSGCCR